MVPLTSLWVPILLSAVIVFLASSILHMVLPYHRSDFGQVPAEDDVMASLRRFNIPPGDYMMPRASRPADMKSTEFLEKMNKGPVAIFTILPSGPPTLGQSLALWFVFCIVVGVFAAYIASRALGPGAPYLDVFRFVGAMAFTGYNLASWQNSIWYKRAWSTTLKLAVDGLVYALLTAGTFGWLWPK